MQANKYIGIPWLRGGRDLSGFDCWGFFKFFYKEELKIDLPLQYDFLPGDIKNIVHSFESQILTHNWVKVPIPCDGDAVVLSANKKIHHIGVWVKNGCLHATTGLGVVFNDLKRLKLNGYSRVEFYRWCV